MSLFPIQQSRVIKSGGYDANGKWIDNADTADIFIGSIQPLTGKETEALTIGRADTGKVKAYSDRSLNVSLDGKDKSGDLIIHDNKYWEVIDGSAYSSGLIPHYKYIAEYRSEVPVVI